MPTIPYSCNKCNRAFNIFVAHSTTKVPECPYCGSNDTSRKMGAPAVNTGVKSRRQLPKSDGHARDEDGFRIIGKTGDAEDNDKLKVF